MALKRINPHKSKGNKSWFDYISTDSEQVRVTCNFSCATLRMFLQFSAEVGVLKTVTLRWWQK